MIQKFSIAKFDFIPKSDFLDAYFNTSQSYEPFRPNFSDSNMNGINLFYNQFDFFIVILLIIGSFAFNSLFHWILRGRTTYFSRKMSAYKYNAFIRFVLEEYMPTILACMITL